ncbi:hypothetical protein [Prevotella sp. HUN102]|uniref:hypothetical protein n=1 Tax=Prevotella sp. HUN102 TaxID=1392486 RepID=UPI00048AB9BF|nr:hypothetical protein [Prevotella sp. HUN102]
MEELRINKENVIACYNKSSEETKETLMHLFGEDVFKFDFRSIKTYKDACKHLGLDGSKEVFNIDDCNSFNKKAMQQADAVYRLITICDAINNGQKYDKNGTTWFPVYYFYTKGEIEEMGETKRKEKGIKLLSSAFAYFSEVAGVRCALADNRGAFTFAIWGFPLCLTSEEKALYVAEQFESLIFRCYGIEVNED